MSHAYRSSRRDVEFCLFEFLEIGRNTLGHGPFAHMDEATAREMLTAVEKFCHQVFSPSLASSDREGLTLDRQGNVKLPDGLRASLDGFYDQGWNLLDLPERIGGVGAPPSLVWAAFEFMVGSNPTAAFYLLGNMMALVIDDLGTEAQKQRFVSRIVERRWGGSMMLTEPDVGSDVGSGRTRARLAEDGTWHLEGTKRFITNGDYDQTENIVHMVLARPEGAASGTKGLSLFIVPKFWVEEDGSLGARNGVFCASIEHKMGLRASATCEMVLGESTPCRGLLMGEVHDGIRQMFHVIEHARMAVGVKSMASAANAYQAALAYTKERVQGPELERAQDKKAPRVRIIQHADVRRMLMHQKAFSEGMRALCLYTAHTQDQVEMLGGHRNPRAAQKDKLNDLLLPLVKGYCSERAYELLALSLQCHGGAGYCQDFAVEQAIRDQKVDTLYEGTTHIQALDLFFRKIARDMGETLRLLLTEIEQTVKGEVGGEALSQERAALSRALQDVQAIFGVALSKVSESLNHIGLHGNRILFSLGELVIGWLLHRQAALALEKLPDTVGTAWEFYTGKVAACRYFAATILPGLSLNRRLIEASTLTLLDVPEGAF